MLAFAQRLELVARDLYQLALDEGAAGDEDRVLQACRDNHLASGDTISGLIGTSAPERRNDFTTAFVDEWSGRFTTSDLQAAADAGYELESAMVATYTELIGRLQGLDGAKTVAAILIAQARMCTVLADLRGDGDDFAALFENEADAVLPAAIEG